MTTEIRIPTSAMQAITSHENDGTVIAWPHGQAIASWRALVRRGHAVESAGSCDGCRSHRPGTPVPVFQTLPGVQLRPF